MSIAALRKIEQSSLKDDGNIDLGGAKKLLAKADDPGERQFLREMLGHDKFDQDAARLFKTKLPDTTKPERIGWIDTVFGVSVDVMTDKELSPAGGYGNKYQALGAARTFDGLAVVREDEKHRWHAYATNMPKN